MRHTWCSALSLVLVTATPALAQSGPVAGFVEGGVQLFYQSGPSGTVTETYVTAPGGNTIGWSLAGGIAVGRRASIVAEWATTGWMKAVEPSRYFTTYNEARRDRTLTAGVRYAVALGTRVALEPMAGVVLTMEQATSQAIYTDPLALRAPGPVVTHDLERGLGPVFGVDLACGGGRVAIVPTFRVLRRGISKGRYDADQNSPEVEIASIYPGGYPEWSTRAGVLGRVRF